MTTPPSDATAFWRAFERSARGDPTAVAVSTPGEAITRDELARRAGRLAERLRAAGVREHGVVALVLPNSVAFVSAFLAVARLPALVATVSARFGASELESIVAGIRPDAVLVQPGLVDAVARHLDVASRHDVGDPADAGGLCLLRVAHPPAASVLDVPARLGLPDPGSYPALFKFSSGSTGAPKAVLWTAANVRAAAANVVDGLQLDAADVVLAPVPLSHSYGFDLGLLPMVFAGCRLVLREGFRPKAILADLVDGGVTVFLGVPALYRLLERARLDVAPDLSSLRYLLSSTASLPVARIEAFRRRFGASISQHYGSSETGGITLQHPADVAARPGSVGRPLPAVEVCVVDGDGVALPAGQRGELVIGGPAAAAGYVHGEPPSGSRGFRDGRYWTGDSGFLDADGFLHLEEGRAGVVHVGGWKVSIAEVARVLESHPAVARSVVSARALSDRRQRVVAAVTLQARAEEGELIAWCRERLADYKVPRRVHVLEALPPGVEGLPA